MNLTNKNFLVINHAPIPAGPAYELVNFLKDKTYHTVFINHPFSYAEEKNTTLHHYEKGVLKTKKSIITIKGPDLIYYLKDVLATVYLVIKLGLKYDYCISADNLNTFSALLLKRLGYVKQVIYMTVDYTPNRFNNRLLNYIYHQLDKFCCYHCNLIWNSASIMAKMRSIRGVDPQKTAKQITVPDGCHFNQIKRLPVEERNRWEIVFMGNLVKGKGIPLLIKAFSQVNKHFPQSKLIIIGRGELKEQLISLAKSLSIEDRVEFTGFINKHSELENRISRSFIAVAPYVPDPDSYSNYSDVGKVKVYLACGLPVIITPVPSIAEEIKINKAGIVAKYKVAEFAEAIENLLKDIYLTKEYSKNAVMMISEYSWEKVFNKALIETFHYL